MPETAKSDVPTQQSSSTRLTLFPSLAKWEDPWEPELDLTKLRRNAAKFDTIRQLSEHPRHGDPLPTIDRAKIGDLVKTLELDKPRSAVLADDARLIAAWYELPQHQARIYMGQKTLLDALDKAADPVRNLYDQLAPFQYETESLLEDMPLSVVGSHRDFDVAGLARKAVEFSSLVDRILEYLRPHNRRSDSRRNVALALTTWAVECATGEQVKTSRGTRTEVNWRFTTSSGEFVRDFMKLLGWPDVRVLVSAFEKLKRSPSVTDIS